ncbi:hypothetical protein D3C77_558820 [compost metagenome]
MVPWALNIKVWLSRWAETSGSESPHCWLMPFKRIPCTSKPFSGIASAVRPFTENTTCLVRGCQLSLAALR